MVERIEAMPAGTIGFKVVSDLTADDYRDRIEPALTAAAEAGEVRLLFEIGAGFGMDAGAVIEDAKTGLKLGIGHMKSWHRTAIVTDVEWIERRPRPSASWRRARSRSSRRRSSAPPRSGSPSELTSHNWLRSRHDRL